jgi:hypothetical protein
MRYKVWLGKDEDQLFMNRREFLAGSAVLAAQRPLTSAFALGTATTVPASSPQNLLSATYTESFLENKLTAPGAWHPYPRWDERAAWEAVPDDIRKIFIAKAEAEHKSGWSTELASTFLDFKRNGNRSRFEKASFDRRAQLLHMVLAECIEGKGRFLDDITNGVWLICEESFWGVPAHLSAQKAGVGLPDVTEPIIELFGAQTACLMAWTYYLVGDQLNKVSPLINKRIVLETERRILAPARNRDDFGWMGLDGRNTRLNNWNPWINSNLMVANLVLEADQKTRIREIMRINRSLDAYLNQYWPDGGEEEGPGYFNVSPLCYFESVNALESATSNTTRIFANPFIDAMGRYIMNAHVAGGDYIDYGDAHINAAPDGPLLYRFGKAVHDEELAAFGAWCADRDGWTASGDNLRHIFDRNLLFMSRALLAVVSANEIRSAKKDDGLLRDCFYPSLGLATARIKAGSADGMYFADLAANNGRSHSHNDTGSYIIYQDGKPVAIDVGVEAYTAKTFSADRYKIWTMQSAYHNLPTIDGVMQMNGTQFKATDLKFSSNAERAVFTCDIASAYPAEAGVKLWLRTLTLDRVHNRIIVEEKFELNHAVPVSLSVMTQRMVNTDTAGKIVLTLATGDGKPCQLTYDAATIEPKVETIPLEDTELKRNWGSQIYRILLNSQMPVASGKWTYSLSPA